ncbi:MAG: PKD domain-containing protein [Flavobacteriales bacterium]|nr:PKD domain-containing protein [Flavobacteriales bacterium]
MSTTTAKVPRYIRSFSQSKNSSCESVVRQLNAPQYIQYQRVGNLQDKLGFSHYTYQQFYQSTAVQGGIIKIHEKNGLVASTSGKEFKISTIISGRITELEALLIAKQSINGQVYREDVDKNYQQFTQKVIVKQGSEFYETYKIDVYSVKPLIRNYVYVSTANGKVIRADNRIHAADANGTAITAYSGTQNIVTDSLATDTFRLRETGRGLGVETYNMQQGFFGGVDFIDNDNNWNNVNGAQDEVATDAHWAAEMFYDYFSTTFGRDSYDDSGAKLITNVHYGSNYGSAFWDGTSVSIGDGDGSTYGPLTTIDIIAHEFSHGIIETTANLVFSAEPGALSESFSDVFATAVEFYAKSGSANWTIKEDAHLSGGADHSLANPKAYGQPDTYFGTNWATGSADNYGVHTNCGVQNYWFYLLTNGGSGTNDNGDSYSVSGIGMTDAMAVAYRALTVYHTSNSQYSDARNYAIQAAEDLFGSCTTEVEAVTNAWYAVGVGAAYSTAPANANFNADATYSCTIPFTVNFLDLSTNAVNYDWDFGDGNTSTLASTANTYTLAGVYTVRLIASGIGCSSSPDTAEFVNYITVVNGGGPIAASCSPSSSPTSTNYGITNVTFNSINKTSGYSSGEDYVDNTCSNQTTVDEGGLYPLSISTGNEYAYAWIDYNNDGSFTTSEQVYAATARSTSHNVTVTIVGGATLNTPLRMRIGSSYYAMADDGCAQPYWGQYGDYSVTLIPNTNPPVADFTANVTTVNTGGSVNFFDASAGAPTNWNWSFTGSSQPSSTSQNPTGITYNTIGSYEVKLVVSNSYGADSITKYNYINVVNSIDMCSGATTTNAGNGTLYDSGGSTGQYSDGENCTLLIDPGCATPITLSFTAFELESSFDYLSVYDGNSTAGTLLMNLSGTTIPSSVIANSGQMFILFTSDGSVTYNGFDANWTSAAGGGAPVAAFSVTDTTPPFNTSIAFNDLTTNTPNQWQWDFGDGNYSSSQNPAHAYSTSGNYTVTLITSNCSTADTTSMGVTVTPPPLMTYTPSSITTTLTCGDSTTVPITFYNSGAGTLNLVGSGGASMGLNNDFYDGFESGNISSWVDQGGFYTKQVVSSTSGGGTYSLELQGGGSNFYDGIMHTFSPATPTEISFKVMSPSTGSWGCMITFGDATATSDAGIGNFYINFGGTMYYNGSSSTTYPFVQNQWTLIEYKNIDFTASTFDLYVDGVLVQAGLIFGNTSLTSIDRVYLSGYSSGVTSYFDDITVGSVPVSSWLSLDNDTAQVANGDSTIYTATINSNGYYAGTYSLDLIFESNDSANPLVTIPVQMIVEGTPNISFTSACLDFDTLMTGDIDSDSILLYNTGCDTLFVYGDQSTSGAFYLPNGTFNIPPYDSTWVLIDFSPSSIASYVDTLLLLDNNDTARICVTGVGVGAPVMVLSPDTIIEDIYICGDSVTSTITISNTGLSSLSYTIEYSGLGLVGDSSILLIRDALPWSMDMVNFLQTQFNITPDLITSSQITTTNLLNYDIIITSGGQSSTYYDNLTNGQSDLESFTSAGGTIIYMNATQGANNTLVGDVQAIYATDALNDVVTPSHPVVSGVPASLDGNSASHNYLTNLVAGTIVITNSNALVEPTTIEYNFGDGMVIATTMTLEYLYQNSYSAGPMIYNSIAYVLSKLSSSANWITISDTSGSVAQGGQTTFDVTLHSEGLGVGQYISTLIVNSNDPLNPTDSVIVIMNVYGSPIGQITTTCIDLDTAMTGATNTDTLYYHNTGCDTLFIVSLVPTSADFTIDTSGTYILPNDSMMLVINFTPSIIQSYQDTITINYNGGSNDICVTGVGIAAPIASVSPAGFTVNLDACGDSANVSFVLYNSGGSALDYNIFGGSTNNDFYDGFESGNISSWVDQGGAYTKQVTSSQAANGTFSLEISDGTSNIYDGIMHTFPSSTATELSFKVRSPSNSGIGCLITIGDANTTSTNGLGVFYIDFSGQHNFSGGSFVQSNTYVSNQWFTIEYKNIDYTSKTLDYYVDGTLVQSNLAFSDNTLNSIDRIYVSGYSSGSTAYIDEIIIGESATNWVIASPVSGSVSAPDSTQIDLTFNSAGLAGGQYIADIIISSNDPVNPQIIVPCTLNISNNPCAGFGSNITSCSGDVDFTDETDNNPTSWQWNFGDGNTSALQNPTNTYSAVATYTVQLIACNSSGCDTVTNQVMVNNIGGPVAPVCIPQTTGYCCGMGISNVTFNTINNSTADGVDGYQDYTCSATTSIYEGQSYTLNITTGVQYEENVMVWIDYNNNGDLEASEIVMNSPNLLTNHATAVTPAIGTVVLNTPLRMRVASDYYIYPLTSSCLDVSLGQYEDYSVIIIPNNVPPVSAFTTTIPDPCSGQVFFTDQSTNSPTSWSWDFGDGNNSTAQFPSNTYAGSGIYTVSLTATNAFGANTYTSSVTINTMNTDFTYSGNLVPGGTVNFFSNSPGAIAWNWGFDNGTSSSLEDPTIAYTATGIYDVSLTATNGFGCSNSVVYTITIADPAAPTPNYSVSVTNQCVGEYLFTDLSTGNPTSWVWDFDDGTTSILQNPSHTFNSSGVFDVSLTAINGFGANTSVQSITVTLPNVEFTYTGSLIINNTIQFIGSSSSNATSWVWSFGDGFGTSIQNPGYSYTSVGEYEVILDVTDDNGCTVQAIETLDIKLEDGIEENNLENKVEIYPNPTNGKFFIEIESLSSKSMRIELVNVLGQSILSTSYTVDGKLIAEMDVRNYDSGVYFVTITDENSAYSVTKRIIIN